MRLALSLHDAGPRLVVRRKVTDDRSYTSDDLRHSAESLMKKRAHKFWSHWRQARVHSMKWARSLSVSLDRAYHQWVLTPWLTTLPIAVASLLFITTSAPEIDPALLSMGANGPVNEARSKENPGNSPTWKYFKPTWRYSDLSLFSSLYPGSGENNPFFDSGIDADALVSDPESRLEPEFKIPEYLKGRVAFWVRVYSQYTSHVRVVHDRHRVDLVYGIIDLRPLHRELGNTAVFEIRSRAIERAVVNRLRGLITSASSVRTTTALDLDLSGLREILSRYGALDVHEGRRLSQNIRTQTGQRDAFLAALHRAKELLPHIESVLKQHGLPVTLARIPFVESSFNVKAESKMGAVGIWQFTPETAREWIAKDEEHFWRDPIRQTRSAARLLRGYRSVLPDWSTTITSYNSGIGRVRRLTEKHRTHSIEKLLSAREVNGLGFAGKNFFAEVMAATIVEGYKDRLFGQHLLPGNDSGVVARAPSPSADRCEQ